MYEANIYINFSKNGVPLIFVDERELDPQEEYPIIKLDFGKFVIKAE